MLTVVTETRLSYPKRLSHSTNTQLFSSSSITFWCLQYRTMILKQVGIVCSFRGRNLTVHGQISEWLQVACKYKLFANTKVIKL